MDDRQFQSPPHSHHVLEITNAIVSPNRKTQSNDGTIFFKVEPELQFQSELTVIRNENESGRKWRAWRFDSRNWLSSFAVQSSPRIPVLNSVSSREKSCRKQLKWREHLLLIWYWTANLSRTNTDNLHWHLHENSQCLTTLCKVMVCLNFYIFIE